METNVEYIRRRLTSGTVNIMELSRVTKVPHASIRNLINGRTDQCRADRAEILVAALRKYFRGRRRS